MVAQMFGDSFGDADVGDLRAQALAHIRRESLDLYNRLHSIAEDVEFVKVVKKAYDELPILRALHIREYRTLWD